MIEQLLKQLKPHEKFFLHYGSQQLILTIEGVLDKEPVKIATEIHISLLDQQNVICTEIERLIIQLRYAEEKVTNANHDHNN